MKSNSTDNSNNINKSSNKQFLRDGWIQLRYNRLRQVVFIILTIAFVVLWKHIETVDSLTPNLVAPGNANGIIGNILGLLETVIQTIFPDFSLSGISVPNHIFGYTILILAYILLIAILMYNPKANSYSENLRRAGIFNGKKETPIFLRKYPNLNDLKSQIAVFFPNGTDKEMWYKKLGGLSNSFINEYANGVEQKGKTFRVCLSRTNFTDKPTIAWENKFLIKDDSKIVLGRNEFGKNEILDFNHHPHGKIGSESGGGKTTLQKLILAQALLHGDSVLVADMKGVDYSGIWQNLKNCNVVNDIPSLHSALENVMTIFRERVSVLQEAGLNHIDKVNAELKYKKYNRLLVVIEEASDILMPESTRKKHEYADLLADIESWLTTIAKQGRALNINLFINCQRPDARSINPDINTNLGYRFCGKADDILSNIVLDNSEAAERIPSNSVGFFVDEAHHLFQSYYLKNEDDILRDCPRK